MFVAYPQSRRRREKLERINSTIKIVPSVTDVNAENIEELMSDVDLVLDGTDNFETLSRQRRVRQAQQTVDLWGCGVQLQRDDDDSAA